MGTFFLYDRILPGKLSRRAARSLTKFFKITLGKKRNIPGPVMTIHACGDYDRWHPYLHALAADGLFLESGCVFMMSRVDLRPLRELFRTHVLTLSKKGGLIDDSFIKLIMAWHHVSGVDMHDEVGSKPAHEKGGRMMERLPGETKFSISDIIDQSEFCSECGGRV